MFKIMNVNKGATDINVIPWVHGYHLALEPGKPVVLFTALKTKEREGLFKWVGPLIGKTNVSVLALADVADKMHIKSKADLKNYNFIALREDISEHILSSSDVPAANIIKVVTFEQLLDKMYQFGHYATIYDEISFRWNLRKHMATNRYKVVAVLEASENYFIFNKTVPDAIVKQHQNALDQVSSNKKLIDKIFAKYLNTE